MLPSGVTVYNGRFRAPDELNTEKLSVWSSVLITVLGVCVCVNLAPWIHSSPCWIRVQDMSSVSALHSVTEI